MCIRDRPGGKWSGRLEVVARQELEGGDPWKHPPRLFPQFVRPEECWLPEGPFKFPMKRRLERCEDLMITGPDTFDFEKDESEHVVPEGTVHDEVEPEDDENVNDVMAEESNHALPATAKQGGPPDTTVFPTNTGSGGPTHPQIHCATNFVEDQICCDTTQDFDSETAWQEANASKAIVEILRKEQTNSMIKPVRDMLPDKENFEEWSRARKRPIFERPLNCPTPLWNSDFYTTPQKHKLVKDWKGEMDRRTRERCSNPAAAAKFDWGTKFPDPDRTIILLNIAVAKIPKSED